MEKRRKGILFVLLLLLITCIFAACSKKSEEAQKLSAPKNLTIVNNEKLTWDEVEHAVTYVVETEGTRRFVTETVFLIPQPEGYGTYEIRVKALGDGEKYTDSEWSGITYLLEKPTEALSYRLLEDGSGYEVKRKYSDPNRGLAGRVVIPDYYNGLPVKRIAEKAFETDIFGADPFTGAGCNTVTTSVRLPIHLESIGDRAFYECPALEDIEIPDGVTDIGLMAFCWCSKLEKIELPSGLKRLGKAAFSWSSLREIVIPEGVTVISDSAFSSCRQLSKVAISYGVTEIGTSVFSSCYELTEINLPESLESIGAGAFSECIKLGKINLPEGLKSIERRTFESCKELEEINLPEGLKSIGLEAFKGCTKLEEIRFPASLESIGGKALNGTAWYEKQADGFIVFKDILYDYKGGDKENTVIEEFPEGIREIADSAFANCTGIVSVKIPEGITHFGNEIFSRCRALTEVILPSDMTEIPEGMFSFCESLKKVVLPEGLKIIRSDAFDLCKELREIIMPRGEKIIEEGAFDSALNSGDLRIYYLGTEEEWEEVRYIINDPQMTITRDKFVYAEKYFYSESEPKQTEDGTEYEGKYWHYGEDGITPVIWKKENQG